MLGEGGKSPSNGMGSPAHPSDWCVRSYAGSFPDIPLMRRLDAPELRVVKLVRPLCEYVLHLGMNGIGVMEF